jgi:DNA mismatch repair protein MSH3
LNSFQATPAELATFMKAFNKIATAFPSFNSREDVGFQSPLLNSIIHYLPTLRSTVQHLIGQIDLGKATTGNKADMWTDIDKYPGIEEAMSVSNQALLLNHI